jgi:hypothetical protein
MKLIDMLNIVHRSVFGLENVPACLEVDQWCTREGNAEFMNFSPINAPGLSC